MEFYVYSRRAIEAIAPHTEAPHVIISITTPRDGEPDLANLPTCENTKGVLRLHFTDLDWKVDDSVREDHLFQDEQGQQIVSFVEASGVDRVLVHCDAGWSRSPAVAGALAVIHNGPGADAAIFARYRPNMRVYRGILRAAGLSY